MDEGREPIFSSREDQSDLWAEIETFVVGLAQQVDELQDAESCADLVLLRTRCQRLESQARTSGYPALAELATGVAKACAEEKADAARQGVLELTACSQRVRLGHRGAL